MSLLVILNPIAGNGFNFKLKIQLESLLKTSNRPYQVVESLGPNHITELCVERSSECKEIIIAGGDGSVQEVINALIDAKIKISIIPSGTGNDLYRSLYPDYKENQLDQIIDNLFSNDFKWVNICSANDGIFVNVASMGLDAKIVENSLKLRRWFQSSKTYLLSALYTLLFYRPKTYTIVKEGEQFVLEAYLIAIGNGKFYGGGMKIIPLVEIEEKEIHVCIVEKMNRFKLLHLLPSVYNGKHLKYKEVRYFSCKAIDIIPQRDELLNLDGELSYSHNLHVNAEYKSLLIR